jgi:transposase
MKATGLLARTFVRSSSTRKPFTRRFVEIALTTSKSKDLTLIASRDPHRFALTIMLETGDIKRFSTVGDYASYCRCVGSQKLSNGKKKGSGNTKNGNKYLAWAFVEAANFAIRYSPRIKSFYQRKKAKSHGVVALKAVAHKLCRACYYIMKDQVPFDVAKAFA